MKDSSSVKEEVLPELGDAVAKKLEFYDGTGWIEINAGGISGKANEITVTPDQSSPGKVISIATNPILPGNVIVNSTGFLRIPGGTTLQRPVVPQVGMLRFNVPTYANVTVAPAFSVDLSPLGTGPTNTVIYDYTKFNYNAWVLEIALDTTDYTAIFYPSGHMVLDRVHLSSLTVSELNFSTYGITLRWLTPVTFAVNDYSLLTFS